MENEAEEQLKASLKVLLNKIYTEGDNVKELEMLAGLALNKIGASRALTLQSRDLPLIYIIDHILMSVDPQDRIIIMTDQWRQNRQGQITYEQKNKDYWVSPGEMHKNKLDAAYTRMNLAIERYNLLPNALAKAGVLSKGTEAALNRAIEVRNEGIRRFRDEGLKIAPDKNNKSKYTKESKGKGIA